MMTTRRLRSTPLSTLVYIDNNDAQAEPLTIQNYFNSNSGVKIATLSAFGKRVDDIYAPATAATTDFQLTDYIQIVDVKDFDPTTAEDDVMYFVKTDVATLDA